MKFRKLYETDLAELDIPEIPYAPESVFIRRAIKGLENKFERTDEVLSEEDFRDLGGEKTEVETGRFFRVKVRIQENRVTVWEPLISDELNDPETVRMEPGEIRVKLHRAVRQYGELFSLENDESPDRTARKAGRIRGRIDDLLDRLASRKRELKEARK